MKIIGNIKLFLKSLIYRIYSSILAFIIAYIFTKDIKLSAYIGLAENIIKIITYYWFDVIWEKYFIKKYKPSVVWLTGLSGAGKTTIAKILFNKLKQEGVSTMLLDGDELRELFGNQKFDKESRVQHVKDIAKMASVLQKKGIIPIVSMISPYKQSRDECRAIVGADNFVEVYVNTSLEECESRDVKGLYKKARAGEIKQFTGIDDPYEPPTNPEIVINTENSTPEHCAKIIMDYLIE